MNPLEVLTGFAAGWLGCYVALCLAHRQTREDERLEWIAEGRKRQRQEDDARLRAIVAGMDARRERRWAWLEREPAVYRRVREVIDG